MSKHTPGLWVNGYGNGVTGPKTPNVSGATVHESLEKDKWHKNGCKSGEYPDPFHTIVSCGMETVAIIPGEKNEREANAALISSAPELLSACEAVIHATACPERWTQMVANAIAKAKGGINV